MNICCTRPAVQLDALTPTDTLIDELARTGRTSSVRFGAYSVNHIDRNREHTSTESPVFCVQTGVSSAERASSGRSATTTIKRK